MKCIHCHKNIPDDSFFCPYCGLIVDDEAEYESQDSPQVLWRPRRQKTSEIDPEEDFEDDFEADFTSDTESDSIDDLEDDIDRSTTKSRREKAEWYSRKPERSDDRLPKKGSKRYMGVVGVIILIMLLLIAAIWLVFSTLDVNERRAREKRQEELRAEEEKSRQQREENLAKNKGASKSDSDDAEEDQDSQDTVDSGDITFSLVEEPEDLGEYYKLRVADASASSVIVQEGTDNSAIKAADGSERTSWQEGVDGDGIGESLTLILAKSYKVKYLSLQLGNWNSDEYYEGNNRPKELEITVGAVTQTVTFPDGKTEYWLELSGEATASEIEMVIQSVYSGSQWEDTCIAEIGVYGTSYGTGESNE